MTNRIVFTNGHWLHLPNRALLTLQNHITHRYININQQIDLIPSYTRCFCRGDRLLGEM